MERTVIVPVKALGEPHAGGCLYEMSNGDKRILTDHEVHAHNQRSIAAGERGGCFPALHRFLFL